MRDLAISSSLAASILVITYVAAGRYQALQAQIPRSPDALVWWPVFAVCSVGAAAAALAAIQGAGAVPPVSEFEAIQSALLTSLKPIDICIGRLAAALWLPLSMVLTSAAFWLGLTLVSDGSVVGYAAAAGAHLVALTFVCGVGSIAFLCAMQGRPGRRATQGACAGAACIVLCVTAIGLINPIVEKMNAPEPIIDAALAANPAVGVMTAYRLDILREPWVYANVRAQDYPFAYPSASVTCLVFAAVGGAAVCGAGVRMRRAYR